MAVGRRWCRFRRVGGACWAWGWVMVKKKFNPLFDKWEQTSNLSFLMRHNTLSTSHP